MNGEEPDNPDERNPAGQRWEPEGDDLAGAVFSRARSDHRASQSTGPARLRRRASRGESGASGGAQFGRARRATGTGWSGPEADDRDPQSLSAAMDRLVGEHGWGQEIAVHAAVARWDSVVGPDVAAHARPESCIDGDLVVRTDSTAWATQLRMLTADLQRRFDEMVGQGAVSHITVLGPQTRTWSRGRRRVPGRGPRDTYG
ncbi:MAG TPA: DciA family protein [Jiangellaceae bacterium]|nr:DciA family protein [Jiangellaceae bacterium]